MKTPNTSVTPTQTAEDLGTCDNCGNKLILNCETGEPTCYKCGLIYEDEGACGSNANAEVKENTQTGHTPSETYYPEWNQWIFKNGNRWIITSNDSGTFNSRLYVNNGQTATTTAAKHSTREGVRRWANKILCQTTHTQPKPTEMHNGDSLKTTEKNIEPRNEQPTMQEKNQNLPDLTSAEPPQEEKQGPNSDTQFGAVRSSNPKRVLYVGEPVESTAIIETIQDLLRLNGSAEFATVALTEKDNRLIAAAPETAAERDELRNEVSNLKHDYEIVSTQRNSLLEVVTECKRWIQGHAHIAGMTANKKANEILAAIAKAEGK